MYYTHTDPSDKAFSEEHKSEIMLYENALSDLKNLTPNFQTPRRF